MYSKNWFFKVFKPFCVKARLAFISFLSELIFSKILFLYCLKSVILIYIDKDSRIVLILDNNELFDIFNSSLALLSIFSLELNSDILWLISAILLLQSCCKEFILSAFLVILSVNNFLICSIFEFIFSSMRGKELSIFWDIPSSVAFLYSIISFSKFNCWYFKFLISAEIISICL